MLRHLEKFLGTINNLPLVRLGIGRGSLADKYEVLMHGFFLIACGNAHAFCAFVKQIVNGTFDYGTEFGLNRIAPMHIEDLFPFLPHRVTRQAQQRFVAPDADGFEQEEEASRRDPSLVVDLTGMS